MQGAGTRCAELINAKVELKNEWKLKLVIA